MKLLVIALLDLTQPFSATPAGGLLKALYEVWDDPAPYQGPAMSPGGAPRPTRPSAKATPSAARDTLRRVSASDANRRDGVRRASQTGLCAASHRR